MKRTLIALLTVAIIGGILFSGCVAPPPESPVTSPEPTPHGTPIPWPTDPNSVLIRYKLSGGFPYSCDDELTIYADGRCELRREIRWIEVELEFTIPPSQLEYLKELIEEANFLDFKPEGPPKPPEPIPDVCRLEISCYAGEGKMNTVRFDEVEVPDALQPLEHELIQLTNKIRLLISYRRRGGDPYFDDVLTILSNGRCRISTLENNALEFTIPPSQLEHLEELMEEANFLGLKETYGSPGADLVEYTIVYYPEEGQVKRVSAWTNAIPDALQPILNELDQLISSNS